MAKKQTAGSELAGGAVVGEVQQLPIGAVKPNGWNPNAMSTSTYESLKFGLSSEGWLSSQALLVWESDETGAQQMRIIDGEHRHRVATDLGFKVAPMVLLKGLSESRAKALTVAMNNRRGTFDETSLGELLRDIQFDVPDLGLAVGMSSDQLMSFLADVAPIDLDNLPDAMPQEGGAAPAAEAAGASAAPGSNVKMVQLFFDEQAQAQFLRFVTALAKRYGTKNVTDTVGEAVSRAFDLGE